MSAVGYLVNCYPSISHSFIRREIRALAAQGVPIVRYTVRRADKLVDPIDREEQEGTQCLLEAGFLAMASATLSALCAAPLCFFRAMRIAFQLGRRSDRGLLVNVVYLFEACLLLRWTRKDAVAHLHAHFGTNPAALALLWKELGGAGYSFTVHGPEEFDKPEALRLGTKISGARFVVAITEFARSQVWRWCELSQWPKVKIVRCGVDALFANAEPEPLPREPRLCWVGRFAEQKGLPVLLDAAALLVRRGITFELEIAGGGPLEELVTRKIAALGLCERVRLVGWLSAAETRSLIVRSRAMVMASFAEGLPVVLMEAMALGRPVVAPAIAGIPELVVPGVTGWLVTPGSAESLATAIAACLNTSRADLVAMGRAGRALVLERHSADREAAALRAQLSPYL